MTDRSPPGAARPLPRGPAPAAQVEDWLRRLGEVREPGALPTPLFDVEHYCRQLPWFQRDPQQALRHYLASGWQQGLAPHPAFDADFVARQLGVHEWTLPPLLAYFEAAEEISAHPLFDVAIFGERVDPARFGLRRGFEAFVSRWRECQGPFSRWFGFYYYVNQEPVTRAGSVNPLLHYLDTPPDRRRDASPMVHSRWYDLHYPAAPGEPRDPLVRYVTCGIPLGHMPNPFAAAQLKCVSATGLGSPELLVEYVDISLSERALAARLAARTGDKPRAVVLPITGAEKAGDARGEAGALAASAG